MGRPGTWGADGRRERTSVANWRKPLGWAQLAYQGLMPDGKTPTHGARPRVFCASLADVFEERPELDGWRCDLYDLILRTPELDWLILTKRPEHAREWLADGHGRRKIAGAYASHFNDGDAAWDYAQAEIARGPRNVWLGVSIENARHTWRADVLRQIPAAVRFISAEPLLGSLYPGPIPGGSPDVGDGPRQPDEGSIPSGSNSNAASADRTRTAPSLQPASSGMAPMAGDEPRGREKPRQSGPQAPGARGPLDLNGIDWVIVGGESGGRSARPMHPEWARELRDACLAPCVKCSEGSQPVQVVDERRIHFGGSYCAQRPAFLFKQQGSYGADGVYRGAASSSGGNLLDGRTWLEFPR